MTKDIFIQYLRVFDKLKECDERTFINAVVEQGGITPHFIIGTNKAHFLILTIFCGIQMNLSLLLGLPAQWQVYRAASYIKGVGLY